jgi:hypothetical protein
MIPLPPRPASLSDYAPETRNCNDLDQKGNLVPARPGGGKSRARANFMNGNGRLRNMRKNFERPSQSFCEARAPRVVRAVRTQRRDAGSESDAGDEASIARPVSRGDRTTNQKANVVISDGASFRPQQNALTHVNQVTALPFGPVAKVPALIIVRLTWAQHAGSGGNGACSHASASLANGPRTSRVRTCPLQFRSAWSEAQQHQGDFEWH